MREGYFRRVQEYSRRRGAAVKRVAENREFAFCGVNANLMRPPCERLGANQLRTADCGLRIGNNGKFCFGDFAGCAAGIFFADACELGFDGKFFLRNLAVGEQEIFFPDAADGELFRERFVGKRRFAEDEDAAGFPVKPVQDGERGPAWFAVSQPVENPLAGKRRRRVRVPAGGFVNHQQMLVLKNHARNHAP